MREVILRLNADYRDLLSNDLGAIGGLLFDVGSGRYAAPPDGDDPIARAFWEEDIARVRAAARTNADDVRDAGDHTHTQIQMWLRDLGHAPGYDVHIPEALLPP